MSGFSERVRTFPPRFGGPIEDGNTWPCSFRSGPSARRSCACCPFRRRVLGGVLVEESTYLPELPAEPSFSALGYRKRDQKAWPCSLHGVLVCRTTSIGTSIIRLHQDSVELFVLPGDALAGSDRLYLREPTGLVVDQGDSPLGLFSRPVFWASLLWEGTETTSACGEETFGGVCRAGPVETTLDKSGIGESSKIGGLQSNLCILDALYEMRMRGRGA